MMAFREYRYRLLRSGYFPGCLERAVLNMHDNTVPVSGLRFVCCVQMPLLTEDKGTCGQTVSDIVCLLMAYERIPGQIHRYCI